MPVQNSHWHLRGIPLQSKAAPKTSSSNSWTAAVYDPVLCCLCLQEECQARNEQEAAKTRQLEDSTAAAQVCASPLPVA
jgi:hypothetical protein